MSEYTEHDIFRSAIDTYGAVMQITIAFEEMSELQKELCKYLRGSGSLPAERCGRKTLLLLRSDRPAAELLSEKGR